MMNKQRIITLLLLMPLPCSSWAPTLARRLALQPSMIRTITNKNPQTRPRFRRGRPLSAFVSNQTFLGSQSSVIGSYELLEETYLFDEGQETQMLRTSSSSSPLAIVKPTTISTTTQDPVQGPVQKEEEEEEGLWNPVNKARLLLLAAAALYGTNFSLVKLMGQSSDAIPVSFSTALRFGMAALATSPWLFSQSNSKYSSQVKEERRSEDEHTRTKQEEWEATKAGLEVGMWNAIGYIAQAVGLETTLASKSAFLCSMAVVIVPILDGLFLGKSLQSKQMVGLVLAILGVGSLELADTFAASTTASGPLLSAGDLASMVQPLAFGIGFWRMEAAMHKFPNQANRSTAAQLLAVFLGSVIFLGTADASQVDWSAVQGWLQDPMIWFSLFWTGVVTTALTVYMETIALKTLSAAETTLIFSSEPVSGSLFAAAVMGERFGPSAIAGSLLILSGCLFSNLGLDGIKGLFAKKDDKDASRSRQ